MFCVKCGKQLPDNVKFCIYCGEKVEDKNNNREEVKTILLRCKRCNGELAIDDKHQVMCCPYCGSKEIIIESDTVKTAQIHADAYRDVEYGKQMTAIKLKQMEIDERSNEKTSNGKRMFKGMLLMLASIGIFIFSVDFQFLFGGGAQLFITVLCIMMFIAGLRIWREDKGQKRKRK